MEEQTKAKLKPVPHPPFTWETPIAFENESGRIDRMEGAADHSAPTPEWLEQIDHTADIGIVVRADSLGDLFARAAWGMFSVITDLKDVHLVDHEEITVDAEDKVGLLLRWLSDLNFRHITGHRLYGGFQIKRISERELTAEILGEKIDLARHTIYTEIKAVTFHGLSIEQKGTGWEARIIFDM